MADERDEGGDPACWAHLFEDDDGDDGADLDGGPADEAEEPEAGSGQ